MSKHPLRRLAPLFRPERGLLTASWIGLLAASGLNLLGPLLIARAIDRDIAGGDAAGLAQTAGLYLGVVVATLAVTWLSRIGVERAAQGAMLRLKRRLFDHLIHHDAAFHDRHSSGRLITRVQGDTQALHVLFTEVVLSLPIEGLTLLGMAAILASTSLPLAGLVLSVLPLYALAFAIFRRVSPPRFLHLRGISAELTGRLTELIRAGPTLQRFNREAWSRAQVGALNDRVFDAAVSAHMTSVYFFNAAALTRTLGFAALIWGGGWLMLQGELTLGALMMGLGYARQLFHPLMRLSFQLTTIERARAAAIRVSGILDDTPTIRDPSTPRPWPGLAQAIRFEGVGFAYEPGNPVLQEVDLEIPAGARVGVVGPTGSGKSTLIQLLLRARDPSAGRVTIDGIDLRDLTLAELRSRIGLVLQDVHLFPGTLLENLGGEPAAARRALAAVGLELPLDFPITPGGGNLSRGERQLLTFARALVRDPEILILDEATSAVDPETERRVSASLDALQSGRTTLTIAHRLETVRSCDLIVVLERGRVVERGDHDALVAAGGLYAGLYAASLASSGDGRAPSAGASAGALSLDGALRGAAEPPPEDHPAPIGPWFLRLWRGSGGLMAAVTVLSALYAASAGAFPWLWQDLIDAVRDEGGARLHTIGGALLAIGLLQAAINLALQACRTVASSELQRRARGVVFDHLSALPAPPWPPGDLVTRLTDDVGEKTSWFLSSGIFRAVMAALTALCCLGLMCYASPGLAAWVALPLPLLLLAQAGIQGALSRRERSVQAAISGINEQLNVLFEGVRVLQACGLEALAAARFQERAEAQRAAEVRATDVRQMVFLLYGHGWQATVVALLVAGGGQVMDGALTLGGLATFEGLVMAMVWPMFDLGTLVSRIPQARVSLGRLSAVLDRRAPEVPEGASIAAGPGEAALSLRDARAEIGGRALLEGVDASLRPGSMVAIVGEIGSGKTTLLRMLAGALPPSAGALEIDGAPVEGPVPRRARDDIAYVPQDPALLSASLEENILLGREIPRADLERALEISRLAQDLPQLPRGLETPVGERGVTLSGGQQQRVALARALAGRPRVLLLDDATAALDADTEAAFWAALERALPDVAAAVVTHRVATIERADQVLVLDGGRVAQRGAHAELEAIDGPYRRIYGRIQAAV